MTKSIEQYINELFPQFEPELTRSIIENSTLKEVHEGDLLLDKGQYFKSAMLVAEGHVKLYREGNDGNEFFVYEISAGEACALSMICALKNEKSEMKSMAESDGVLIQIPLKLMDEYMQKYRTWYYFVLETYRSRFEHLLDVLDQVIFMGMDDRLLHYLKSRAEKNGSSELHLTHQQIANDLNSSREVISRLMKKMESKGIVRSGRNSVTLLK